MWKKFLPLLSVLMLTGCVSTITGLTPLQQTRNANNLYPVEVQFNSPQQSIRWDSVKAYVLVNGELYPMRPVPMVPNRWDGFVSVPPSSNEVTYRFKFEYLCNAFGSQPKPASSWSPAYKLKITGQ